MNKKFSKSIIGLSLIEILIGIMITSIMMAAMYTSYDVVNKSYNQVSEKAKISRASRDLVSMLMRDVRMAGFKYYAGSHEIAQYAAKTAEAPMSCTDGMALPKLSYLGFDDGFDDSPTATFDTDTSHNPLVIRRNTLGPNRSTETRGSSAVTGEQDLCCDQIQIVYEDFNMASNQDLYQPYKKYRITYFAKKTGTDEVVTPSGIKKINRYGAFKLVQGWEQRIEKSCVFPPAETGSWVTTCDECTAQPALIRDHIEDMEFIPFDENGRIIKSSGDSFVYPAPEHASINDRIYDIRGVDIKIIFRSKDNFFKEAANRQLSGLTNRNKNTVDRFLRDTVIVSVHTRNIGGQGLQ